MIRIDYTMTDDSDIVTTTWVAEETNRHSLIGRLVFTKSQWEKVWKALVISDIPPEMPGRHESYFLFENKQEL